MVEKLDSRINIPHFLRIMVDGVRTYMDGLNQQTSDTIKTPGDELSFYEIQALLSRTSNEGHTDGIIRM